MLDWGFLGNNLKALSSAAAWNRGSAQEMAENTGSQREGGQPQGTRWVQEAFCRVQWRRQSLLPSSGIAQMGQLQVRDGTAVNCPTPYPVKAPYLKCEVGVRDGELSALYTKALMHRKACVEAVQRGIQKWTRSKVRKTLEDLNKIREATFSSVTTGWAFTSALVRRGWKLIP